MVPLDETTVRFGGMDLGATYFVCLVFPKYFTLVQNTCFRLSGTCELCFLGVRYGASCWNVFVGIPRACCALPMREFGQCVFHHGAERPYRVVCSKPDHGEHSRTNLK